MEGVKVKCFIAYSVKYNCLFMFHILKNWNSMVWGPLIISDMYSAPSVILQWFST
jgi:hypothetical protein